MKSICGFYIDEDSFNEENLQELLSKMSKDELIDLCLKQGLKIINLEEALTRKHDKLMSHMTSTGGVTIPLNNS